MKYFMDTEFIEDGKYIDLLSIGIVAEDGRKLYLEAMEADFNMANDWVKANVIPHMHDCKLPGDCVMGDLCPVVDKNDMKRTILAFMDPQKYGDPEIWGYYADYDWVVFCQIFGTMVDLPRGFPMYCLDLKQLSMMLGNPEHPKQTSTEHNAMADALYNQELYQFLLTRKVSIADLPTWTLARSSEF